jgi:hypothetical protein
MLKLVPPAGPFLLDTAGDESILVPTLEAASSTARALIKESGVGSRDWSGAVVRLEDTHEVIAVLSYNCRAWSPSGRTNPEGQALPGELEFDLTGDGAF